MSGSPATVSAFAREGWDALRPYASGVYANFLSDEGAAGVETAYGDRLTRLTALKDRFDPLNVFRMNANIPPTGWESSYPASEAVHGQAAVLGG
jgi:berberine-like enzyme